MFYFFKKGTDTITCEVRTSAAGPGYDIIIIEPGGAARRKHPTSEAVHKRWLELLERFQRDAWWGTLVKGKRIGIQDWIQDQGFRIRDSGSGIQDQGFRIRD